MTIHELLRDADRRLVRTVDAMDDAAFTGPSLLPDWTRAHVVAHLALNAEALAGALDAVTAGEPAAVYPSQEARDQGIEALAAAAPSVLRERLLGATTDLLVATTALPHDRGGTLVHRVPGGGRSFRADEVMLLRLREVEIHLVDLGLAPTYADWSPAFTRVLLDSLSAARNGCSASCVAHADDLGLRWTIGEPGAGPTVTGPAATLGWWLTGRGDGAGLSSDSGTLPQIGTW